MLQYNAIQLITDIAYLICDWVWENLSYLHANFCHIFGVNFFPKNGVHLNFLPFMHQTLEGGSSETYRIAISNPETEIYVHNIKHTGVFGIDGQVFLDYDNTLNNCQL